MTNQKVGQIFDRLANSSILSKNLEQGLSDPAKFAAGMLVTSIVSKDLVGCYYYTTQSLHNKKIPEEKRKFVAALDLMNGIIMVGGQLLIGKVIDAKLTPKLLSRYTGIVKDKFTGAEHYINPKGHWASDNILDVAKKVLIKNADILKKEHNVDIHNLSIEQINNIGEKVIGRIGKDSNKFKAFSSGFGLLVAAIATTALTKRTLAPLLSTPLAGWFKRNYMDDKKKNIQKDRIYYEWKNLEAKSPAQDKTSFSKMSSRA
jgi:hypothetical protein